MAKSAKKTDLRRMKKARQEANGVIVQSRRMGGDSTVSGTGREPSGKNERRMRKGGNKR